MSLSDTLIVLLLTYLLTYLHYFTLHIYIFVLVIVFTAFWQWINKRICYVMLRLFSALRSRYEQILFLISMYMFLSAKNWKSYWSGIYLTWCKRMQLCNDEQYLVTIDVDIFGLKVSKVFFINFIMSRCGLSTWIKVLIDWLISWKLLVHFHTVLRAGYLNSWIKQ